MSLFATYCGLLLIASAYDIKNKRVPALLIAFLMLAPPLIIYGIGNLTFNHQVLLSIIFTFLIVIMGYVFFGFGGADGKILLGISFILPIDVMAMFLFICLSIFTIYFTVFFAKKNEAPFVPAIAITAIGLDFVTSM